MSRTRRLAAVAAVVATLVAAPLAAPSPAAADHPDDDPWSCVWVALQVDRAVCLNRVLGGVGVPVPLGPPGLMYGSIVQ